MNAVDILINLIADLNDFSVKDFQITLENRQNFSQANKLTYRMFSLLGQTMVT
jgi:hypothetical protein